MTPSIMLRRLRRLTALAALAPPLALGACKKLTDPICAVETDYAIVVILADSITGQVGPFHNLALVAADGSYKDSLFVGTVGPNPDINLYNLAKERAGTYAVSVHADEYRPWIKTGIVVERDECHVMPATVRARLAPL